MKLKQVKNNEMAAQGQGKKTATAIGVLLLSFALLFGSLFAFFSDQIGGKGALQAGSVKLVGATWINPDSDPNPDDENYDAIVIENGIGLTDSASYLEANGFVFQRYSDSDSDGKWKWEKYDLENDILNPGDMLRLVISVKNTGSKSIYLKPSVNVSTEGYEHFIKDVFTQEESGEGIIIYNGSYNKWGNIPGDNKPLSVGNGNEKSMTLLDNVYVMSGGLEEEKSDNINVDPTVYSTVYTFAFKENSGNSLQEKGFTLNAEFKALQYRNNEITDPEVWDKLFSPAKP